MFQKRTVCCDCLVWLFGLITSEHCVWHIIVKHSNNITNIRSKMMENKGRLKLILFSTEMVNAILDGRKTQTRRVVKKDISNQFDVDVDGTAYAYIEPETGDHYKPVEISRIRPSDILWVRETWQTVPAESGDGYAYVYKASSNGQDWATNTEGWKWRPSIYMPKEAARVFLRVKDVRVERVQEIDTDDAIAEGCSGVPCDCLQFGRGWMGCESCMNTGWQEPPIVEFMQLWDSINSKRGFSWDINPWVWPITFERTDKPEFWPL